jgi:stearoyl-CoA desaturase (delta-9 desaturase)
MTPPCAPNLNVFNMNTFNIGAPMRNHGLPLPHAPRDVVLSPLKILWNGALIASLLLAPLFFDARAALFAAVSALVILAVGHSAGFHRGIIHGAYRMGPLTERVVVYLAALAGIGGPIGMLRMHNTRDRHQNRPEAPDYYTFAHSALQDAAWYLFHEHTGPVAPIDPAREAEPYFRFLERTWRWQQLPWAIALFLYGGTAWVIWGVGVRTAVCVLGHWYVNYAAHTRGYRRWRMPGSGEEGRNHPVWGALAMGEGWHNNHHAWPDSAKFGVAWWEVDPGWWVVATMRALGLAWDVKTWESGATLRATAIREPIRTLGDALRAAR